MLLSQLISVMGWLKLMVGMILIMNVASHTSMLKEIKKIQKDMKKVVAVNNKQDKAITSIEDETKDLNKDISK